jgi:hypothetical protein
MGVGHEELLQPPLEPGRVNMPVRSVVLVLVAVVSLKLALVCAAFRVTVRVLVLVAVVSLKLALVCAAFRVTVRVLVSVDIVAGMHRLVHAPASRLRLCGAVL